MGSPTMTTGDVARLLGRAAFGATAADFGTWVGKKYADLVEKLLDVPSTPVPVPAGDEGFRGAHEVIAQTDFFGLGRALRLGEDGARGWWLERMRTTPHPLLERMVLFWHNHFATAVNDETSRPALTHLLRQNDLLRQHALGDFRVLLDQITLDPAMLYWLNGADSRVPYPNENYAREFFELFTLGRRPQVYTERDVREAARAFTGWTVLPGADVVRFDADAHDKGSKRVLGTTFGNLGDQEYKKLVEIALKQPVAPLFVAWKLVTNFGYFADPSDLLRGADPLVRSVAAALKPAWDVKAAMRTLLLSDEFRYASPARSRQVVRQPAEIVVHGCKILGISAREARLQEPLRRMGQVLFRPPNVGGWPRGTRWLSPVTTLARYELALILLQTQRSVVSEPGALVGRTTLPAKVDDLAAWARTFGVAGWSGSTQAAVRSYLAKSTTATDEDRRTAVFTLLFSSPDWVVM